MTLLSVIHWFTICLTAASVLISSSFKHINAKMLVINLNLNIPWINLNTAQKYIIAYLVFSSYPFKPIHCEN